MKNYILAILLTTVGAKAELSRLEALSLIESGDNDAAVGSAGEVSRFQILPHVWLTTAVPLRSGIAKPPPGWRLLTLKK